MDDAAGDLKQALLNVCDSIQIHVEVHQKSNSVAKKEDIRMSVLKLLNRHNIVFGDYKWTEFDDAFLNSNVQSVSIVDTELKLKDRQPIDLSISSLSLHIFHLNEEGPASENLEEENEDITAAHHWVLPAAEFHGLWESLIYDTEVKSNHEILQEHHCIVPSTCRDQKLITRATEDNVVSGVITVTQLCDDNIIIF